MGDTPDHALRRSEQKTEKRVLAFPNLTLHRAPLPRPASPMSGAQTLAAVSLAASLGFFAISHGRVQSVSRRLDKVASRVERERQKTRRGGLAYSTNTDGDTVGDPNTSGSIHVTGSIPGARLPSPQTDPRLTSHPGTVKVALCQLKVGDDKFENIENMTRAVRDAALKGTSLVVLPEMWNCPYANSSFPVYAEVIDERCEVMRESNETRTHTESNEESNESNGSPSVAALVAVARETGVVLVGGSIPERCPSTNNLYNSCIVIDGDGTIIAKHRKTHLFDLDIPGEITFKESDTLTQGDSLTVVDTAVGRLGIGICFDIRFPELASVCANRGASILIYPGAFNTVTGPLHWDLLQKARAVDNQVFVLTCSPARDLLALEKNPPGYQAYGYSSVIGPFAEVLGTTGEEKDTVFAQCNFEEIIKRRRNMPLGAQRRGDLYALVDRGDGR